MSDQYVNTPQFLVAIGEDVFSAMSEGDLTEVLDQHVRPGRNATVYKLDGDVVYKNGKVNYFPLGFES